MAEEIKPELLEFLQAGGLPYRILVVESLYYLPELRQMFPQAEIFAVAAEEEAIEPYGNCQVDFRVVDYLSERLPFEREFFDYIISDLTLEAVANPQDIAAGFSMYLKQTGSFLTSFRNIRHWSILEEMMEGHFYHLVTRLYAKTEFERLLYASYYKNVRVRPQVRRADTDIVERLVAAGFENIHEDLETEFWLVQADRSMPEMALLKSMYTKEQRKELSDYLHRIEYDVDAENQCRLFWAFYEQISLFPDYTANFIRQAVFHPESFYRRLMKYSRRELDEILAMLECTRENATSQDELRWIDKIEQELQGMK
ncbi:methyltransferase domain-containing protein [Selenomonas ruminis]|uniref:Methyltransferase type 11 domain-containing protein n=1 Tax=Selenomonas ruminis TaxID=2593411 RepID=A0A5D6W8J1_9FIRM|nr:methyltransferase domain-containing protein [Selenomonas sp. mPRGC5]TYZ24130.1 hypothetical protein FZ040_05270 [Selenomonas sp. mPRGC5]